MCKYKAQCRQTAKVPMELAAHSSCGRSIVVSFRGDVVPGLDCSGLSQPAELTEQPEASSMLRKQKHAAPPSHQTQIQQ